MKPSGRWNPAFDVFLRPPEGQKDVFNKFRVDIQAPGTTSSALLRDRERQLFPERQLSLLSFDANAIQKYIFQSNRRRVIEGASRLLDRFDNKAVARVLGPLDIPAEAVIYAGGGGGLIWCPHHLAADAAHALERAYIDLTGDGSCTTSWVDLYLYETIWGLDDGRVAFPRDLVFPSSKPIGFGDLFRYLAARMQTRKQGAYFPSGCFEMDGWLMECESCHVHPALKEEKFPWGTERLCEHCQRKMKASFEVNPNEKGLSFEDIASSEGDIAVLYGDGNGMGKLLEKLPSPESYGRFSESLTNWIKSSVTRTAFDLGLAADKQREQRYLAPILGGDDLCIILPANYASFFVGQFVRNLKRELDHVSEEARQLLDDVSFSFGLFFAPHTFPLSFLFEEAHNLLSEAKTLSYKHRGTSDLKQWCLSFRATSRNNPGERPGLRDFRTGRRPYHIQDFETLVESLRAAKQSGQLPRSQLYLLRQCWEEQNPAAASLAYHYQYERIEGSIKDPEGRFWPSLCPFLQPAWTESARGNGCPEPSLQVSVSDMINLWEYI